MGQAASTTKQRKTKEGGAGAGRESTPVRRSLVSSGTHTLSANCGRPVGWLVSLALCFVGVGEWEGRFSPLHILLFHILSRRASHHFWLALGQFGWAKSTQRALEVPKCLVARLPTKRRYTHQTSLHSRRSQPGETHQQPPTPFLESYSGQPFQSQKR